MLNYDDFYANAFQEYKFLYYFFYFASHKKTGLCRGIPIFLIFDPKHTLWVLVRTASAIRAFDTVTSISRALKKKKKKKKKKTPRYGSRAF